MKILVILLFASLQVCAISQTKARFVKNEGQWEDYIKFKIELPNGVMKITEAGFEYHFIQNNSSHPFSNKEKLRIETKIAKTFVRFLGLNKNLSFEGLQKADEKINFFIGNNPRRWKSEVSVYDEILIKNLYDGISMRLFTYGNSIKYEYLVDAEADYHQIRLAYSEPEQLKIQEGNLYITTQVGIIKELKPYSYQKKESLESEVASKYVISDGVLTFDLPEGYNKNQKLVIDPILVFSTFSGLKSDNWAHTATFGDDGSLYAGGSSNSTLNDKFESNSNAWDVCILKFSSNGSKLLYTTYFGGNESSDIPHSIIENSKGELLIFGTTGSRDFPTSENAFDRTFNGGKKVTGVVGMDFEYGSDMFVSKLSKNGTLLASTYFGGNENDGLNLTRSNLVMRNYGDEYRGEIIIDKNDQVYIAAVTNSSNFPVVNAVQINKGDNSDAVVFSLDKNLTNVLWSTYLGGNGFDAAYSLKVSSKNEIFVGGVTSSQNFKLKSNTTQTLQGSQDGFLVKFGSDFQLLKSILVGSNKEDLIQFLDIDKDDSPHIFGLTSGAIPTTSGVYTNLNSGQFIQGISNDLEKVLYSTVIGTGQGVPDIIPTAFSISDCGNIYLSGWGGFVNSNITSSYGANSTTNGLPITPDATKKTTDGSNFYIALLEKGAKSLLYATYFGASSGLSPDHVDGGTCRFDKKGNIYHVACSCNRIGSNSNFILSPGAYSSTNPSLNCNNVAFKFNIDSLKVSFDIYQGTTINVTQGCSPLALRFVNTSFGAKVYDWDIASLAKSQSATETAYTFDKGGDYVITLKGSNPLICNNVGQSTKTIRVVPTEFKIIGDQKICTGKSVQLTATGGTKYKWSPAEGLNRNDISNPIASPKVSTKYTLTIENDIGCSTQLAVNVDIDKSYEPDFSIEKTVECGKPVTINVLNKANGFDKFWVITGTGDTLKNYLGGAINYKQSGKFELGIINFKGICSLSASKPIEIEQNFVLSNVLTPNNDGKNDTFEVGNVQNIGFEVFDRWGKSLYQNPSYKNEWGKDVKTGTYFYELKYPSGNKCKGWLEVIN